MNVDRRILSTADSCTVFSLSSLPKMTEEHSSPIKTPKQLIIVVLVAFAVPIALAGFLSQLVTSGEQGIP